LGNERLIKFTLFPRVEKVGREGGLVAQPPEWPQARKDPDPKIVKETGDILMMWLLLKRSYANLSSMEKKNVETEAVVL
jgi:hypothetical protein